MKFILFLLGLMMGSFAFGQTGNTSIKVEGKHPNFFPSDSLIKEKRIKSIIHNIHNNNVISSKEKIIYDSIGREIRCLNYNTKDTTLIEKIETYFYKPNLKYHIDSVLNKSGNFEENNIET